MVAVTLAALPLALLLPGLGRLLLAYAYAQARRHAGPAALRRLDPEAARAWRRRHRLNLPLAGLPAALLALVPVANLLAPIFGAAAFAHLAVRLGASVPGSPAARI